MIKVIKKTKQRVHSWTWSPTSRPGCYWWCSQRRLLGHTFLQAPPASSSAWTVGNVCSVLPGASLRVLSPKGRALPLAASEPGDLGPQGRRDGAHPRGTRLNGRASPSKPHFSPCSRFSPLAPLDAETQKYEDLRPSSQPLLSKCPHIIWLSASH